jgi:hypothetical protein
MTTEYEIINIKPSRSAPLRFRGKLIAQTEWTTGRGDQMRFEIWLTEGGALIAVRDGDDGDGNGYTDAIVVEPVDPSPTDEPGMPPFAMRNAVMDFLSWHDRARRMVRQQLRWSLLRRVA